MSRAGENIAGIEDDTGLVPLSNESASIYSKARRDRRRGLYQDAIKALETLIEREADYDEVWAELALAHYQLWETYVKAMHTSSILDMSLTIQAKRLCSLGDKQNPLHLVLLHEAYHTFLVAMEYPTNKTRPELLLPLIKLYLEFGSYRGALAVCTLLVEGYASSSCIKEAILLSAITASALNRHRESAQYFQYLAESQDPSLVLPDRLATYQLRLLAAFELSRVPDMRALEREIITQAYKALHAFPPRLPSEKTAHTLFKTSRKSEEHRTMQWYQDGQTWLDLAQRLAILVNAPLLILSVLGEARQRMGVSNLLLEGTSRLRLGDEGGAEKVFAEALLRRSRDQYYSARPERFLLEGCSPSWRAQFALEQTSATQLQALLRHWWRLARWRLGVAHVLEQRRHAMAIRIQCAWRRVKGRQELALLRMEQRHKEELATMAMSAQDSRTIAMHLNAAATKMQSLLCIMRDKRTLRALRAQKIERENLLARFAGRRTQLGQLAVFRLWRRVVNIQRQEVLNACVLLQRQVRVWRSRKLCAQLLRLHRLHESVLQQFLDRRSASLTSCVFQAWHKVLVEARDQRQWGSRLIQKRYRSHLAVRQYHVALQRHRTAIDTMNRLLLDRRHTTLNRGWSALSHYALQCRVRKRNAARSIQKHVRGVLTRKRIRRLRARRRRALHALGKLTRSCAFRLLQTGFDLWQQHVQEYHRKRHEAARRIARRVRDFQSRQKLHHRQLADRLIHGTDPFGIAFKHQPVNIQLWACLLALSQCVSQRDAAVMQVQRWWRHRKRALRDLRALRKCVAQRRLLVRLQDKFYRLARVFLQELRTQRKATKDRQDTAATKLQRRFRCWFLRRQYLSLLHRHSIAAHHGAKAVEKLAFQRVRRLFDGWREATRVTLREVHEAAWIVQRTFRRHRAQRRARCIKTKRAAQARYMTTAVLEPLARCFRQWETATVLEKSVLRVRSSSFLKSNTTTHASHRRKQGGCAGSKWDKQRSLEERSEVSPILFYTLLNRVRQTGICQLSYSGGTDFKSRELRQLLALSTTLIVDGSGGHSTTTSALSHSPLNLVEQVVEALEACASSTVAASPVQTLILCNAPLRAHYASLLSTVLHQSRPSSHVALVSVVLANVPLKPASVVSLACSLAQNPKCLQQLVLERCQVGNAGAAALFEALKYNRVLWKLDLSGNHIADAACPALAQALVAGSPLRVLVLSGNLLSNRGIICHIAPALASSQLDTIALLQNPRVSSVGIAALRQAGLRVVTDCM